MRIKEVFILLKTKSSTAVNNQTIFASEFQLYLPTEKQLIEEINKEFDRIK
jgi:hypothetical protein